MFRQGGSVKTVLVVLTLCICGIADAQMRVTRTVPLALPSTNVWQAPRFSPDGKAVFLTTVTYDGIWAYTLSSGTLKQITDERGAGYGYTLSPDMRTLAFRRKGPMGGADAIVQVDLHSLGQTVLASNRDISLPTFTAQGLLSVTGDHAVVMEGTAPAGVVILGIENTKILAVNSGTKTLMDPLEKGSYIWPTLSPDGRSLVAVDMARGGFVTDVNGTHVVMIGHCDAPSWTRSNRWIISMDDRDDGQQLISSDLVATSRDGAKRISLTSTTDLMEMFPQCSPTENRIVCSTADGKILLLDYEEAGR
jgi:Tol biopolymer transport system component